MAPERESRSGFPRRGEGFPSARVKTEGRGFRHHGAMTFLRRVYGPIVSKQLYLDSAYLVLGLVFGVLWFSLLITLYAVGFGTAIIWVGIAILAGTQALLRPIGTIERSQVRWLLRHDVPTPLPLPSHPSVRLDWLAIRRWAHDLLHDGHGWRVLGWVMFRLVSGPVGFSLAVAYLTVSVSLLAAPFMTLPSWGQDPDDYAWDRWLLLGPVAFLIAAPILAWAVKLTADAHRALATRTLGPCGDEIRRVALARASRAEEQIRIDQELHDSIGHMISMIVVQAGAGAHVFDRDPAFARRALSTIEERGRAALGELDRLIARIRGDEPETTVPLPGADDLPHLIEGARDAGVAVTARLELGSVPAPLGRGTYRVVQEALTNAAKHAPGEPVDVSVVSDGDLIAIAVRNPMRASVLAGAPGNRGNGLASIRDRVAIMGGHATAGPDAHGGFAVRAVLPLGATLPPGCDVDCRMTSRCRCLVCRLTGRVRA